MTWVGQPVHLFEPKDELATIDGNLEDQTLYSGSNLREVSIPWTALRLPAATHISTIQAERRNYCPLISNFAGRLRKGNQHGGAGVVGLVLGAEDSGQVALFQIDAYQNVTRGGNREEQVAIGHFGGDPEGDEEAKHEWVAHEPVEPGGGENWMRVGLAL